MPAYVIAETEVTDPERYEQYKAAVPAAIAAGSVCDNLVCNVDFAPTFLDLAGLRRRQHLLRNCR